MKTFMKTALLACLLFAALQFGQASPAAALAETKATNSLAAPGCFFRMIQRFFRDLPNLADVCLNYYASHDSSPSFPICVAFSGGADLLRTVMDISSERWGGRLHTTYICFAGELRRGAPVRNGIRFVERRRRPLPGPVGGLHL
ncbi:uncharacterized protein LOC127750879 [Frankliniella occidentalis]|uniref:Uncharacterized protein LOC127750879 n=1 Tax=Frankliniella occidentalis TaxID=133901 RepID=A0A9C6X5I1_FRAOC|nr:uncharacterized protein LOC127750879 [Frankliniella occidentalis]